MPYAHLLLLALLALGDGFAQRKKAAGDDPAKLWELALSCEAENEHDRARETLERLIAVAPDHEGARAKLGHHRYDDRWFETYRELSNYRKAEAERMAERGLVRHAGAWVPKDDVAPLLLGWTRDAGGGWVDPVAAARAAREARLAAEGWQRQDLCWVAPAEFDAWRRGLYKCGDRWLEPAEADAFHADLAQPWILPGERCVVRTTLDRESARWAVWWADQAVLDLATALGIAAPERAPTLAVVASLEQYNELAAGSMPAQRPAAEQSGWSSVHYAFVADSWVERGEDGPEFLGAGVCYWAVGDPGLAPWGRHAVRHAAAQALLETLDPSPVAVAQMIVAGPGTLVDVEAYWAEKDLPLWLRFGLASWCERYFHDAQAAADADPWWARTWARERLAERGGLGSLDELFALRPDPSDPEGSERAIARAGCVASFAIDGGDARVRAAFDAVARALASRGDVRAAASALEQSLRDREDALRDYARG